MALSVFSDKSVKPDDSQLKKALGRTYELWTTIKEYVHTHYSPAIEEWNFSGQKWGWSFRMKHKKRTILYFTPLEGYFRNGFVFGDKAVAVIEKSEIPESIKDELLNARKYMEGRGLRVDVKETEDIEHIKILIEIKMSN
jgi:hypothetical protein